MNLIEALLGDDRLGARAVVLVIFLALYGSPVALSQAELSKVVRGGIKGDSVRKAVREAEEAGWLSVDRSVQPHRYQALENTDD